MCNKTAFPIPYIPVSSGAEEKAAELKNKIAGYPDSFKGNRRIYYVSESGRLGNNGFSPEKPLMFSELCRTHLRSGDTVLFERNSVFRVGEPLYLCGGVNYGAYGSGEKPALLGSLRNYAAEKLWSVSPENENIWILSLNAPAAGAVMFDNDSYMGIRRYGTAELNENGDYYHDATNGIFYLYSAEGNPGKRFSDIEIGTTEELVFAQNVNDIGFENIRLRYASIFGMNCGGNRGMRIAGCDISYIGGHTFKNEIRYGNGIQFWLRGEDISVSNCRISQIYDAALTFQGCGAENAYFDNIRFEHNLIEYCSMNFEYWAGSGSGRDCRISNIAFSGNTVRLGGCGWGGLQRPDKGNQALVLGWNRHYESFENFVISGNIFDCAEGNLIFALSPTGQSGLSVFGNSYYQRKSAGINPFTEILRKSGIAASDRDGLLRAVLLFDSAPNNVVWVE